MGVMKGDARSLDYSSYRRCTGVCWDDRGGMSGLHPSRSFRGCAFRI